MKQVFKANNGQIFDTASACLQHEEVLAKKATTQYDNYLNTYSCASLLKKHSLYEEGTWKICGEDPNCDWGGQHSQPYLGTLHGKLTDVIKAAVVMPHFWTWGGGGTIEKIGVVKV